MSKLDENSIRRLPVKVDIIMGRHRRNVKELLEFGKGFSFKLEDSDSQIMVIEANGKKIALGVPVRKKGIMHVKIIKLLNN